MTRPILTLLLLTASLAIAAEDILTLDKWRVQPGDDPTWAQPDFDDSSWPPSPWPRRHTTGQEFFAGIRWYRSTTTLPPTLAGQSLAIAVGPIEEVFDVFINGIRVGTHGDWEPIPKGYFPRYLSFPIPNSALQGTALHVAIRRWTGRTRTNFASLSSTGMLQFPHPPEIGPAELLRTRQELRAASALNTYAPNLAVSLSMIAAGALSLALFIAQPNSRNYLWLGLALVGEGLPPLFGLVVSSTGFALRSVIASTVVGSQFFASALWAMFLARICERLRHPLRLVALAQALIALAMAVSYGAQIIIPESASFTSTWISIAATVAAAIALLKYSQGAHSAILAAALVLQPAAQFWFTQISFWLGMAANRYITLGPLIIDPRNVARLIFAITALTVLYLRHRRDQQRQTLIEGELAAARMVQESLLAGRQSGTPNFAVEAAYLPASEVGGDFYREMPSPDGSLLVLVGDVSGKGLRAALLVGHISGALSNERSRRPAEILANLNDSLAEVVSGGFVTCCCVRFHPDGVVTIANAGHLQPYLAGRELPVDCGLPLGILRGTQYAETQATLPHNQTFVLLSDGVIEAANPKGELFGFTRTQALANQPAHEIAAAAQSWGQNDDITVLTVRRTGL